MTGNSDSPDGVLDPLAETVADSPLLLLISALAATLLPIVCGVGVLTLLFSALFGIPEFTRNETTYEGLWLLMRLGPILLVQGTLAGMFAFSVWKRREWGRGLAVLFWASLITFASLGAILYPSGGRFWFAVALNCVPMLLATLLYLYRWGSVVAYYRTLQATGGTDDPE